MARIGVLACVILLASIPPTVAQQPAAVPSNSVVPQMVRFSGTLADMTGKSLTGIVGVTFYLYKDSQGGAPLWIETQNVRADKAGHYSVMLGSTSHGLPGDLFASGEARWLGVQAQGQAEQPRVMLLAVPYALKAADAETLGGKPLSAFQLTTPQSNNSSTQKAQSPAEQLNEIACAGSTACKASFIPRFFTNGGSATVNNSVMSQSGTNIHIAGSESVSGNISSGANVSGQNGNFTNVNASWAGVGNGSLPQAIFAQSTAANGTGVQGVALGTGNTAGVLGHSNGQKSGSAGVLGVDDNVTIVGNSYTTGMTGQTFSPQGIGVLGLNGNRSSEFNLRVATHTAGVWGDGNDIGIVATSDLNGLWAVNNHPNAASIVAQNDTSASNGLILYATAPNVNSNGGSALCTINTHADLGCTGDVVQSRPANGLAKALVYFDPFQPTGMAIVRCYNSQLAEPAASTPPCGFKYLHLGNGANSIDFGFTVSDRFFQGTPVFVSRDASNVGLHIEGPFGTAIVVETFYTDYGFSGSQADTPFNLTVF